MKILLGGAMAPLAPHPCFPRPCDNTKKFNGRLLFASTRMDSSKLTSSFFLLHWFFSFFVQSLYLLNSFWINIFFTSRTAIIYFPFLQPSSLLFNGKCLILHSISFNCKESCSNCNHFFQPYKVEGCNWKYRTALSSNVYPQSLSFLQCILTGSYQPKELLKMDFTTDFSR